MPTTTPAPLPGGPEGFWFEYRLSADGPWRDSNVYDTYEDAEKAAAQALDFGDVVDVSAIHDRSADA